MRFRRQRIVNGKMRMISKQPWIPNTNLFGSTVVALGLIVALAACETPATSDPARRALANQPTDRMDAAVFATAAEVLLKSYDADLRLAIRPIGAVGSGLTQSTRRRLEQNLIAAIRAEGGEDLKLRTRSELGKLVEDINLFDPDALANVQVRAHADALLITDAHPISEGLSLSFAIHDMRPASFGETLAATSGYVLPFDLEMAETATATAAVRRTAVDLARTLLDDEALLVSNLRFASRDGDKGGLSAWLSSMLVGDLAEVVPEIRKGRWVPVLGGSPRNERVWVSTETWDQGTQVQARFRLSRADGSPLAERSTRIASRSIPFGVWAAGPGTASERSPETTVRETAFDLKPGRSTLSAETTARLVQLGQRFAGNTNVRFRVDGHASYMGGTHDPALTAELRATYVQGALMRGGVEEWRIKTRRHLYAAPGVGSDRVVVTYGPGVL